MHFASRSTPVSGIAAVIWRCCASMPDWPMLS
jgi:hypothetical protein